jgi:aminoglycoside/choline kinase family phosphotransferase
LDIRKVKIQEWLQSLHPGAQFRLETASSDASFRRYFRLYIDDTTRIVMDAPPEHEETGTFCRIARRFHQQGINVPEIIATDESQGFVLMSDLGSRHYLDYLDDENADSLYADALESLARLQAGTSTAPGFLPPYSEDLLRREMDLYRDWYLERHLGVQITNEEHALMDRAWDILVRSACEQPQLWVHRDYHSRNLMITEKNNPGVIDFQDAVTGPITYDLVSLLKDCYIEWPAVRVKQWVLNYHRMALQRGLLEEKDETLFLRWFHRMGIQRHLKVAGIFARLSHRDGKHRYLDDIPLTLKYLVSALEEDDELGDLYQLVVSRLN